MCGITGFIDNSHAGDAAWIQQTAQDMADSIVHRGPDDGNTWADTQVGLGLGHRRLAVVDLSPAGRQPMISNCERFVIVYNGEVYNAEEIRNDLKDLRFRGHSDTEVVLEACAAWGVKTATQRLNGMFGFAIWDRQERSLSLVRDRLGIKPLYWGSFAKLFLFGSELKAFKKHPGWRPEIDRNALAAFMQHRYIPAPHSIYTGIHKLEPGHILTVREDQQIEDTVYWSITDTIEQGQKATLDLSDHEAIEMLDSLLGDAVGRRMVADVPVGAFLSGGIDSAAVVALMQQSASQPARTFTIGFNDASYNEAHYASAVAKHLGTDHTELYVGPEQAREVIPALPTIYDEPFADSSQIPTFLVSQMTRQHVTVALSGDGGDELFAGYNRYQTAALLRRWTRLLQGPLRKGMVALLTSLGPASWNNLLRFFPGRYPGHKLYALAGILNAGPDNIYRQLVSEWSKPAALVAGADETQGLLWTAAKKDLLEDPIEQMQYLDSINYLPDNILTKVDRASMAVSLEARTPVLDHRVVEFAWRLPMHLKIRENDRKWLLRQVLYKYVPCQLLERRKTGFKIPVGDWLGGPLRDWSESLLDEKRLRQEGFLDPVLVREKWDAHLSGHRNWKGPLWNVLMFQAWLEAQ
jgi:asparagine synthase (glutamine-hydrolysing)